MAPAATTNAAITQPQGYASLPSRRSDDAPQFDSDEPQEIDDFLADIHSLGTLYGLTSGEKVHAAVRYADAKARKLWRAADGYDEDPAKSNWAKFKTDLTDNFYKSSRKSRYSMRDLEDTVRHWKKIQLKSEKRLEKYYQEFIPISAALKKKSILSESEVNRWFWKGIERRVRDRIEDRISRVDTAWDRDTAPTISAVLSAARWVLKRSNDDSDSDSDSSSDESDAPRRKKSSKRKSKRKPDESDDDRAAPAVQTKTFAMDDLAAALEKMTVNTAAAIEKLGSMQASALQTAAHQSFSHSHSQPPFSHLHSQPSFSHAHQSPFSHPPTHFPSFATTTHQFRSTLPRQNAPPSLLPGQDCYFCLGEGHFIPGCEWVPIYVAANRIIVDGRRICFPDGTLVRRGPQGIRGIVDQVFGSSLSKPSVSGN
ncbi:hypothetical protein CYLTODRAFT_495525 [Cylindrobasidium torrendii FP15055 ss-10]|uniref:Retrotransposon gag domain-containing protein n=1 Tax=Cylindrobasidium torrendii FP15055 ss-10 TaxID=1314674 RepID=A0A0D7ARD9_9AGAR|nr:hypothetical protein CYLTODRAFT_495525 [Cylindrobasidium torrendii FP15055 ss-10]